MTDQTPNGWWIFGQRSQSGAKKTQNQQRCLRWSLSFVVPLPYGTLRQAQGNALRERGSKLRAASRREVRASSTHKHLIQSIFRTF
ncbi:hypothetical protein LC607_20450 [Nostoc sp. CHAB 5824]|nr:hypothetical protein [Nostoc sp. CHAB 5824]